MRSLCGWPRPPGCVQGSRSNRAHMISRMTIAALARLAQLRLILPGLGQDLPTDEEDSKGGNRTYRGGKSESWCSRQDNCLCL